MVNKVTDDDLIKENILESSPYGLNPAPGYCDSDTLLASLYRVIGLNVDEKSVYTNGCKLVKFLNKIEPKINDNKQQKIKFSIYESLLKNIICAPISPRASSNHSKTFIDTPLTPSLAVFSGTNSFGGNPWVPGNLIKNMICLGSQNIEEAKKLWEDLFNNLNISDNDDIFAIYIEDINSYWLKQAEINNIFNYNPLGNSYVNYNLTQEEYNKYNYPAKQFVHDLRELFNLKGKLCRKQWITLLDSLLRIASCSHVLWICSLHSSLLKILSNTLNGNQLNLNNEFIFSRNFIYASPGERILTHIKEIIGDSVRFFYELSFWTNTIEYKSKFKTLNDFNDFFYKLSNFPHNNFFNQKKEQIQSLLCTQSAKTKCSAGRGKTIIEYIRHILGQRDTLNELLTEYDQGYFIKKKSRVKNSQFIMSFGSAAILASVYCATSNKGRQLITSIDQLQNYFHNYGILVTTEHIENDSFGKQLRQLGLLLDSPDAESTMQLLPPFLSEQTEID